VSPPALEPGEEGLAISLPVALKLADAQAWDIIIAQQQLRIAAAELEGANVLWLPTLQFGFDYQYHSGPVQQSDGTPLKQDHTNMYVGGAPWPSSTSPTPSSLRWRPGKTFAHRPPTFRRRATIRSRTWRRPITTSWRPRPTWPASWT
jgi:hypothetical protein